jgi:hypothetical protein
MVAAAQWNIRETPEADIEDQQIWGIKFGGEYFSLYYLDLSRDFQVSLKHGRSPPQTTCKVISPSFFNKTN